MLDTAMPYRYNIQSRYTIRAARMSNNKGGFEEEIKRILGIAKTAITKPSRS